MSFRGRPYVEPYNTRGGANLLRPSPNVEPITFNPGTPVTITIVHSQQIINECIAAGFRAADPKSEFKCHASVEAWVEDPGRANSEIILSIIEKDDDVLLRAAKDIAQIRNASPASKLILLSHRKEPQVIFKVLELGVEGYVGSDTSFHEVLQVFQLIRVGGRFFPASILNEASTAQPMVRPTPLEPNSTFSPRQLSVAKALRRGTPNKIIAYELSMCESTVKVHVRQIMKKLKAKNRTEVAYLTNQMFLHE